MTARRLAGVSLVDIAILIAVAVAAFAGFRKGFIGPLVAVGLALVGLYSVYAGPGASMVPSGTAGIGLGVVVVGLAAGVVARVGSGLLSLVHRVGILEKADKVLGLPLGAVTGVVTVYLALVAIVSFDNVIAPLHGKASVDQAAVAAVRAAIAANPQFGALLDPSTLDAMASQVARSAIPSDQIATYDKTLALYESDVRPQLLSSALAPLIVKVGELAPFIGRHVDFPTK